MTMNSILYYVSIYIKELTLSKTSMMGGTTVSKAGTLTMHAEELVSSSEFLQLGIRGKSLANKDGTFHAFSHKSLRFCILRDSIWSYNKSCHISFILLFFCQSWIKFLLNFEFMVMFTCLGFFSKSDPYFEIHKVREDGTWIPVYRSIYIKNTLNPVWPTAKRISIQTLCNGKNINKAFQKL